MPLPDGDSFVPCHPLDLRHALYDLDYVRADGSVLAKPLSTPLEGADTL
jgi:hypothetical protein